MKYTENELVRIAKRENNTKRNYLVVDPLQGKHIPVSPTKALELFTSLADTVRGEYEGEHLLLVGFAETATAIGAQVAVSLGARYIQTTREPIQGVEYLFFSEEHSHATEQKLVKNDIDSVAEDTDRIIFVEDEVTTGKTILNIITILDRMYEGRFKYSVASLLNGMGEEHLAEYAKRNIRLHYLVKTDHSGYIDRAEQFAGDGEYVVCAGKEYAKEETVTKEPATKEPATKESATKEPVTKDYAGAGSIETYGGIGTTILVDGCMDSRRLVNAKEYEAACGRLYGKICETKGVLTGKSILVIGTEECMYPALFVGNKLENAGNTVRSHSTTRSPIAVSTEKEYPIHCRYELKSLYDEERRTFIYDITAYDEVFIVTDAGDNMTYGLSTLMEAVKKYNDNITLVRWC